MNQPAYEGLYEKIRQEIANGAYVYGEKLPGKRTLAEQNDVSVITVAHALALLADEGYIVARERSGCYVSWLPGGSSAAIPSLPLPPSPSAIQEAPSSADVDGFPFSILARTMRRVLAEKQESILIKTPNAGLLELRQAISRYLARSRDILAAPEQIIIGSGAEYLYSLIVELLGDDLTWAIETPSYHKIEQVYAARGIQLEKLPLIHDGIQPEALAACQASVLHVSPYRSYPSDVTASVSRKEDYLCWVSQGERWIVEDDFESEFSLHRRPVVTIFSRATEENVIYLNTFSRTISSALRAGYMVLPRKLLPRWEERCSFFSCTVPAFEQYVLAELIESGKFERHINSVRRRLRSRQA